MIYAELLKLIQGHFTDGLVLVVGSGLSAAEGMPGMPELADHLLAEANFDSESDRDLWQKVQSALETGDGLEAALLKFQPTPTMEDWIVSETCRLLLPKEKEILSDVLAGKRVLGLTALLQHTLKPKTGIPILTPNYDRLVEIACEMAGYHVDTTAIGHYAGEFNHDRSVMASCKGIVTRARKPRLEHYPRALVLKPHGSFDWYRSINGPRRCTLDLNCERLIITPGLNKYRAGYEIPFDKHRELANFHISRASRLLVAGYGFNDDHLQTHLLQHIREGASTLILTLKPNDRILTLAREAPDCVCLSKPEQTNGVSVITKGVEVVHEGHNLWDIKVLSREALA